MLTTIRDRAMPGTFRTQLLFAHQPSYPLARALDPLRSQFGMDSRAAIHATIGLENDLHLFDEFGIFPTMLTRRPFPPSVVSAHRHVEHPAHQRDRILVPVLESAMENGTVFPSTQTLTSRLEMPSDGARSAERKRWACAG